jgi:hypothetical protein
MAANWNQGARTSYENDRGQKINPYTRQTVSDSHPLAHFYLTLPRSFMQC